MGFPKPWPTEWPEIKEPLGLPDPDVPLQPEDPTRTPKDPDRDPVPEYRRRLTSVTWAVNHACNLKCTHCYDVVPFERRSLSTENAINVVDKLKECGVSFVAFSGGEPFLRRDLIDLMSYTAKLGMAFGARSNGTRITPEMASTIRSLGIRVVGVSFDGAHKNTHDAVRGVGAFDAAVAGFRNLRSHGVNAMVEVVLSKANVGEALDFIELGVALDATEVNFSAMTAVGRGVNRKEDLLDHGAFLDVTRRLRGESQRAPVTITPNCALFGDCFANVEPHITCDGWLTPCYLSHDKLLNVLDTPADTITRLLTRTRAAHLDNCGRTAWLRA